MRLWLLALLLVVTLGCEKEKGPKGTPENPWVIGMSQCNLGEPWREQMNKDIAAAAAKHDNIKVVFKDAQNDKNTQRAHVEEFLTQKIDLLIISPKDTGLTKVVAEAFDKGVPVVVLDRAVDGDQFTAFIGGDNTVIGRAAGQWVRKTLGGKGQIVELRGLMTSTPAQDRHSGFREGLGDGFDVVFDADMQWQEGKARSEMESALTRHKEIDLVYAHNDPGAHGAYLAAKAAGRDKDIKFVGIDALPQEGVRYVEQGVLAATFTYPTLGPEAIAAALAILQGKKVAKKQTLGTRLYTKANVASGGEEVK